MMQLHCPCCGPRSEDEFHYGGPAHLARPALDCTDDAWAEYLFMRDNARGPHNERWRHTYGCGQWFNLTRDTATHDVVRVYAMGEPPGGSHGI